MRSHSGSLTSLASEAVRSAVPDPVPGAPTAAGSPAGRPWRPRSQSVQQPAHGPPQPGRVAVSRRASRSGPIAPCTQTQRAPARVPRRGSGSRRGARGRRDAGASALSAAAAHAPPATASPRSTTGPTSRRCRRQYGRPAAHCTASWPSSASWRLGSNTPSEPYRPRTSWRSPHSRVAPRAAGRSTSGRVRWSRPYGVRDSSTGNRPESAGRYTVDRRIDAVPHRGLES